MVFIQGGLPELGIERFINSIYYQIVTKYLTRGKMESGTIYKLFPGVVALGVVIALGYGIYSAFSSKNSQEMQKTEQRVNEQRQEKSGLADKLVNALNEKR